MEDRLRKVEQGLSTHEAVCAERYEAFINRQDQMQESVQKIHSLFIKGLLAICGGMGMILANIAFLH